MMAMTEQEKKMAELARKWGHRRADADISAMSKAEISRMAAEAAGKARADGNKKKKGAGAQSEAGAGSGTGKDAAGAGGQTPAGTGKRKAGEKGRKRKERKPYVPKVVADKYRTPPNKHENNFMIDLMVMRNALRVRAEKCVERLKLSNDNPKRDLGLLFYLVDKLEQDLLATMPDSRDAYYARVAKNGRYHLDIDGPIQQGHTVLITDKNLGYIVEVAMEQECLMCLRTGSEIDKCPLRTTLLEISPATKIRAEGSGTSCEYRDCVGKLLNGEMVTV